MIAWMYRFINNTRKIKIQKERVLSVNELESAEKKLMELVQRESLKEEDVKNLCTFIDNDGIRRQKTKITRRSDDDNCLCPIVLPSKHEIVDKLMIERHLKSLHDGVQFVRHDSRGVESFPTPLPEDRIRDSLVFEVSGVDLAGPLHLKDGKKAWILLFTCAVYRALHLELIQSLSTSCFMLGFRRFIARRGRLKIMYSDNGSNFVGTDNLLQLIDWEKIINDASIFRIQWKFNPPTAAWWGGWWERIVQMIKRLLRRFRKKIDLPQPGIVASYNRNIGGVDLLDRLSTYRPKIKGKKLWTFFTNTIHMAVLAARRVHREVNGQMSRLKFLRDVVMGLETVPNGLGPHGQVNINTCFDGVNNFITQTGK
ncbi:uncharacterized protein [Parasteatoda tepidariorum]|uniref:uncharacterized protein n=1 Tax=Parasteatoda tepidariorum TaxID=114398 RepID=UPI0039BD8C09